MRFLLCVPFFVGGCSIHAFGGARHDVSTSSDLTPQEMTVDLSAQSYEDGKVDVYASVHYGAPIAPVALGPTDSFDALAGGDSTRLGVDGSRVTAALSLPRGSAEIALVLSRSGWENGRYVSTVTLPAAPKIVASPDRVAEGTDLAVDLAAPPPAGTRVRLRVWPSAQIAAFGESAPPSCLDASAGNVLDASDVDGARVVLASGTLFARSEKHPAALAHECDVRIGVRFEAPGTIDRAFGAGSITSVAERSFAVHLVRKAP